MQQDEGGGGYETQKMDVSFKGLLAGTSAPSATSVRDASVREYAHTCVFIYIYEYISCLTRSYC